MMQLVVPEMVSAEPAPGKRVRQTLRAYKDTDVHHAIWLPTDWEAGQRWPVVVEFTGNRAPWCASTGEVKDANMGYGLTKGEGYIWVTMPYISENQTNNQTVWWGDATRTADYCKQTLRMIFEQYGGDEANVCLCGFSRGAIGVNFIGLHDDEIALLWSIFIANEHYDGVVEWEGTDWGSPLEHYRRQAHERLSRLRNRPVLIIQNDAEDMTRRIRAYLDEARAEGKFTFMDIPVKTLFGGVPNEFFPTSHTDKWLLFDHAYAEFARDWLKNHIIVR